MQSGFRQGTLEISMYSGLSEFSFILSSKENHYDGMWIQFVLQIYTDNWVNSPAQQEDNSWQAFIYVPEDNWYIAKARPLTIFSLLFCLVNNHQHPKK